MNRIQYRGKWYTFQEAIEIGLVKPTRHERDREERPQKKVPGRNLLLKMRKSPENPDSD
ncbi:MAG: hypothetical protein IRY98_03930 [Alicyclobacillaceae bacterium]|nr:hypothetical protein [Alicyclobacillaceae bacterium]